MAAVTIDYLAVIVAAVAGFTFGAAWYMTLGKAWMAALGATEAELKAKVSSPLAFGTAAVAQLVIAFFLAGLIGHLAPGGVPTAAAGLTTGFFVWLAFILPTMAVNHRFQGAALKLSAIDSLHWLGVVLAQGLVIGLFG
jgi:hypothetical protein